jgi:hypothetical protein
MPVVSAVCQLGHLDPSGFVCRIEHRATAVEEQWGGQASWVRSAAPAAADALAGLWLSR